MAKTIKTRVPAKLRSLIFARDAAFVCVYCLSGRTCRNDSVVYITVDHVIAEARGGKTFPVENGGVKVALNLVKCCKRCNDDKHNMSLDLWFLQLERDTGLRPEDVSLRVFRQTLTHLP